MELAQTIRKLLAKKDSLLQLAADLTLEGKREERRTVEDRIDQFDKVINALKGLQPQVEQLLSGEEAEEPIVESVEIELTPAAIEYILIPVRQAYRRFFPGYREEFILETDIGEIKAKVTGAQSKKDAQVGDPNAGSYIKSVVRGGLKPWYVKHSDLRPGDKVVIESIETKKRYRLRHVSFLGGINLTVSQGHTPPLSPFLPRQRR